jgi:neurotransmitter:Na+ symporter, NSS family
MTVSDQEKQSSTTNSAKSQQRGGFSTALGALFATLGSAVGLGNIWKFPSEVGTNGGAAFIIVYLLATLLVGLPVMISEIAMGRSARANAIDTMRKVSPNKKQPWWLIGVSGVLAAFFIMAFYTEVAGWVFAYIFKSISGGFLTTDPGVTSQVFVDLISNPWQALLWQWLVLVMITIIIIRGVSKGIEATAKRLIPLLFVLLLIIGIRSLTLPGAMEGLKFLFTPDFSKLTAAAILSAMGLAFFKLSVGMGTMTTYGSYWKDNQNIPGTTARVMLADLFVSLLAGVAIFPAVFSFGLQVDAGPSLLFITIPTVFASMPLGGVFMVMFFVLAAVAATGAMLSLIEVPVAFFNEQFKLPRAAGAIITAVLLGLIGSLAALSSSVLADVSVFGKNFFDLFDFLSSNVLLPLGGFFITIFVGWFWGKDNIKRALTNNGSLQNETLVQIFIVIVKFVTPLLVLLVLLNGFGLFNG